jgi:hypothetical protein
MLPGYPKEMRHPAYVQGRAQEVQPKNWHITHPGQPWTGFGGSSDRFPPVTVTDPNQQEFHESRGYVAVDGSTIIGIQGLNPSTEYPKYLHIDGEEILVNSVEEESEAMLHNTPGKLGSPDKTNITLSQAEEIALQPKVKLNKDGTPRKKAGPPKGYKKKPVGDKHAVTD